MTDQMQAVRDTVIEILRENGVKRAAFFGSIVRGEMDEESDIDILIEFEGERASSISPISKTSWRTP